VNYPIIYDKLDTAFLGYGLAILENAKDVCIREVLNGEYSLKFALPINDSKWEYVVEENLVKVEGQLFVIRNISDAHGGEELLCTVSCEHVFFLLLDDYIEYLELSGNATGVLNAVLEGTAHSIGTVDIAGDQTIILEDQNPVKAINNIISLWGGEIKADNFDVDLLAHRGSTIPNIQFRYRKNISSINRTVDTNSLVTRLYVYGNDGLTIEEATEGDGKKYIDSQYIGNYRRPKTLSKKFDIDDVDELYSAGETYLKSVEIPYVSYEVDVIELKTLAEYGPLEEFTLGDECLVIDDVLRVNVQARIKEYERYPMEPWRSRVVLANFRPGMQYDLSDLNDMKNELITQDGSMKVSTAWFEGVINGLQNQLVASGSYATAEVIEGKGILFENTNVSSNDYGAVYIGPGILAIADEKIESPPTWNWRTFGTGKGFTGDLLLANTVKADALIADTALIEVINGLKIIAGSVEAKNITTEEAYISSGQIASLAASKIDVTTIGITNAQIEDLEAAKITAGTLNSEVVYAGEINAEQINTVGLAAESIYEPGSPTNYLELYTSIVGDFFRMTLYKGAENYFQIGDEDDDRVSLSLDSIRTLEIDKTSHEKLPQGSWDFSEATVTGLHAQWG